MRKYDLVIIGDVPASYFNSAQMDEIHAQIKSGGSLLMLAGPMAAPTSYRDTPIETIRAMGQRARAAAAQMHDAPTEAAKLLAAINEARAQS